VFRGEAVPDVLTRGDHAEIRRWREGKALERTRVRNGMLPSSSPPSAPPRSTPARSMPTEFDGARDATRGSAAATDRESAGNS
jgi:hypothetical protein